MLKILKGRSNWGVNVWCPFFFRMIDSYDSAIIPLGSDAVLRDRSKKLNIWLANVKADPHPYILVSSVISSSRYDVPFEPVAGHYFHARLQFHNIHSKSLQHHQCNSGQCIQLTQQTQQFSAIIIKSWSTPSTLGFLVSLFTLFSPVSLELHYFHTWFTHILRHPCLPFPYKGL